MAAPVERHTTANTCIPGTSIVVTKPTGTVENDMLYLTVGLLSGATITPPTGFVEIETRTHGSAEVKVYEKRAGGSEPSNYTVTLSTSTNAEAIMTAVSGAIQTGSAVDVSSDNSGANSTAGITYLGVTTTVDECLLLGIAFVQGFCDFGTYSGLTEEFDGAAGSVATATAATAGATGNKTCVGSASNVWLAFLLAIKPPAVADDVSVTPDKLALVTSGKVPVVTATAHQTVAPGVLAMVTTKFAPQANMKINAASPTALVTNSLVPVLKFGINGAAPTTLALTTFTPQLRETLTPTQLALILATFAPDASFTGHLTVTPDTLALLLASFAPQLQETVTAALVQLVLATFAPDVSFTGHYVATPDTLALLLAAFAPQFQEKLTPALIALTLATFAPQLREALSPTTLSLALTTFALQLQELVTATTVALILASFAPDVAATANALITPDTFALILTKFAPDLNLPTTLTPTTLALVLTSFAPLLSEVLTVGVVNLLLNGFAPVLGDQLSPSTASLALTGLAPQLQEAVSPSLAALILSPFPPLIAGVISPPVAALLLNTFAPTVTVGGGNVLLTPGPAGLVLVLFSPDVTRTVSLPNPGGPWPSLNRLYLHQIWQQTVQQRSDQ